MDVVTYLPPFPFPHALTTSLALLIASEANGFYAGSAFFKLCASLSFVAAGMSGLPSHDLNLKALLSHITIHYPFTMALGLVLSLLGDAFLIPSSTTYYRHIRITSAPASKQHAKNNSSKSTPEGKEVHEGATLRFQTGTFFFALAHISYTAAFLSSATAGWTVQITQLIRDPVRFRSLQFALSFALGLGVASYLGLLNRSNIELRDSPKLVVPDELRPLVKVYIGIIMTMVSVATATDDGWQKITGAWMFMISDLFVAVDVFARKNVKGEAGSNGGRPGWKGRSVGWIIYFWAQLILAGTI